MLKKIIFNIVLVFSLMFFMNHTVFADEASELQDQINKTNEQIEKINTEIKKYENQIAKTNVEANSLKKIITELNLIRNKLLKEKELTNKKISLANSVIKSLEKNIDTQNQNIISSKKSLSNLVYDMHQNDEVNELEKLFSGKLLSFFSKGYNDTLLINESIRRHMLGIKEDVKVMDISKDKKEVEQKNLTLLQKTLIEKTTAIESTKKEKDTLLLETKNQEANYKKQLAEQIKKRDIFESSLRKYEEQLKFVLNPKSLPSEGSGVLSWPLDNVLITQLFGRTVSARRLYASGSHSGVDFRASVGTAVKSMADGVVVGTGDTDLYCKGASFGKWVFIKYNNGLSSTYGHLSSVSVNAGGKVNTGDTVALSGNTGHSTGPHLHVTVYASDGASVKTVPSLSCSGKTFIMPIAAVNAYLDPILYMPKVTKNMIK